MAVAALLLVIAVGARTSPTGGGAPGHRGSDVGRLLLAPFARHHQAPRDAGCPAWHYVLYLIGPFLWLALTVELIEYMGIVIALGLLAFFVAPGVFPGKAGATG
jgi:hypothetical protein